jgi:hypothetical protein
MHYINTTQQAKQVRVWLNMSYATGSYERAGAFVTFNTQISIPPMGTQTVSGDCAVPDGAKFFTMGTHSHKYTTEALAARANGEMLVHTTDWEHADSRQWPTPFLTFTSGEKLHYQCSYQNPKTTTIVVGDSAEANEMCMAVGYYFPAKTNRFCLNSASFDR